MVAPATHLPVLVLKLQRRLVDGHLQVRPSVLAPLFHLLGRCAKYPVANFHNQANRFRDGDEFRRRYQAKFRVLPTNQGLGFGDGSAGQCTAQVIGHAHALLRFFLQVGGEKREAIAPLALGFVHGLVSQLQQVIKALTILRQQADTDAG